MPKKKEDPLKKILTNILYEVIHTFLETWKERSIKTLPNIIKKISKKVVLKYVWLAVLCIVGLLLISQGIVELLAIYQIPMWASYLVMGSILLIIAGVQFKKTKEE